MSIINALVEFVVVAAATILAEKILSTRAAVIVLCCGLLVMGWLHREEIKPVYEVARQWASANRFIAIGIFIIFGASIGGAIGLWLTAVKPQAQSETHTDPHDAAREMSADIPKQPISDTGTSGTSKKVTAKVEHPPETLLTKRQEAEETKGPHFHFGFHEVTDEITITLGSVSDTTKISDLKKWGKREPFSFYGAVPVTLSLTKDDQLAFSFTSWTSEGPVTVKDNEVTIGNPLVDRNFGENAFEIVDRNGQPIFQMIRKNPNIIVIYGIFPTPNISQTTGLPLILWISSETGITQNSTRPLQFNLKPIFKYPSWKHLGKYAEDGNQNVTGNTVIQGPGSIAQLGGSGNTATIINPPPKMELALSEWVQRPTDALPPSFMNALEVTIQPEKTYPAGTTFNIDCTGRIGKITTAISGSGQTYMGMDSRITGPEGNIAYVTRTSPAVGPNSPIVLILYSEREIKVKSVRMGP